MDTARKTAAACAVICGFLLLLYIVYLCRDVLLYLFVAAILATAINPLVARLERWRLSRVWATVLAVALLLVVVCIILGTIIVPLIEQGVSLAQNLPQITQSVFTNPTFAALNTRYHFAASAGQLVSQASALLLGSASLIAIADNIIGIVSSIVVISVITFLLLIEGETLWNSFVGTLREQDARVARRVGPKISKAIGGFVSGNLLISVVAGIVTLVVLWILHVPYLFALAALVALFDLIPLIGTALATVVVGLVALTQGWLIALIAVVILLTYQFVEGHIIQPVVYSRSINLSALFIVLASLLGAELAGIVGILLAIPTAAIVQIIVTELFMTLRAHIRE